jgi:raffinose/stachyose/melibiose transport system permease protein
VKWHTRHFTGFSGALNVMSRQYRLLKPLLFLSPAIALFLFVIAIPSVYTLVLSCFEWNGLSKSMKFVGLNNYVELFATDVVFRGAIINTLLWTLASLIFMTSLSLLLAMLLNMRLRGRTLFRAVFYFPSVLAAITVAMTWRWLYHPTQGLINRFMELVGLPDMALMWLGDPSIAMASVFVASIWFGIGQPMVIFLAGLQTIPAEPYEAALIDGANVWQTFTNVTIPGLSDTFVMVFATVFVSGMKIYDLVFAMTGGGPAESTQVLSTWMYFQSFQFNNVGTGAAITWVLIGICMLVIIPYVRFTIQRASR